MRVNGSRRRRVIGGLTAAAAALVAAGVIAAVGLTGADESSALEQSTGEVRSVQTPSTRPVQKNTPARPVRPPTSTVPFEVRGKLAIYPKALLRLDDNNAKVRNLEARLVQLGLLDKRYLDDSFGTMTRTAVSSFQTSKDIPPLGYVDRHTWDRLVAVTRTPTRTELYPPVPKVDSKLDPRCATGRVMCIDKTSKRLRWVVDGKVQMTVEVRFGSQFTPTREGKFSVYFKSRDHVSSLYDTPMPFAMFFSGGQAVHYSADFAARGYDGASHGCVNVRNWSKIEWLFGQVRVGDDVVVYRS